MSASNSETTLVLKKPPLVALVAPSEAQVHPQDGSDPGTRGYMLTSWDFCTSSGMSASVFLSYFYLSSKSESYVYLFIHFLAVI